jgi:hypothetical protein
MLKRKGNMKWINVNDILPEVDENVLYYSKKNNEVWLASIDSSGIWWVDEFGKFDEIDFWMPLPKPPKF